MKRLLILALALALSGCASAPAPSLRTVRIQLGYMIYNGTQQPWTCALGDMTQKERRKTIKEIDRILAKYPGITPLVLNGYETEDVEATKLAGEFLEERYGWLKP